jgi:hypothetical protein
MTIKQISKDNNLEFEFSIKWKLPLQHLASQHMKVVLINFNLNYKAMLVHYIMILEKVVEIWLYQSRQI